MARADTIRPVGRPDAVGWRWPIGTLSDAHDTDGEERSGRGRDDHGDQEKPSTQTGRRRRRIGNSEGIFVPGFFEWRLREEGRKGSELRKVAVTVYAMLLSLCECPT